MRTRASRARSSRSGAVSFSSICGCRPHFSSISTTISHLIAWPSNSVFTFASRFQLDEEMQEVPKQVDAQRRHVPGTYRVEVRAVHFLFIDLVDLGQNQARLVDGTHPRVHVFNRKYDLLWVPSFFV